MHVPKDQTTPWVYGSIPSRATEQPSELKTHAENKPAEDQVQNLKPHKQASGAFESENTAPVTGRGSLSLEKFEKVISRITNAVKTLFNEWMGKKAKPEVPLEKQLADVQQRKKSLQNHIGNAIDNPALLGVSKNIREAYAELDRQEAKLEKEEQKLKNEISVSQPREGLSREERRSLETKLGKLKDEKMDLERRFGSISLILKKKEAERDSNVTALTNGALASATSMDPDEFVEKLQAENNRYLQLPEHNQKNELQASLDKLNSEIKDIQHKLSK